MFNAEEAFEEQRAVFESDSRAGVCHEQFPTGSFFSESYAHRTAVAVVLHCVIEKVAKDLGETERIHVRRRVLGKLAFDTNATVSGYDARVLGAPLGNRCEVMLRFVQGQSPSIGAGK